jgi:hypothetical protein
VIAGWLIAEGRVPRARIGVAGENVPIARRYVRHFGLERETGVRAIQVERGGARGQGRVKEATSSSAWAPDVVAGWTTCIAC